MSEQIITKESVIIKTGTETTVNEYGDLIVDYMRRLMSSIKELTEMGLDIHLVSSGAVKVGLREINKKRTERNYLLRNCLTMHQKSSCAEIGQIVLANTWLNIAKEFDLIIGQVLLTSDDFVGSKREYLSGVIQSNKELGIKSIYNANDTVSCNELGNMSENDSLARLLADLVGAKRLFFLSKEDGLYRNYKQTNQELIRLVNNFDDIRDCVTEDQSIHTSGGMFEKIRNIRLGLESGLKEVCLIGSQNVEEIIKAAKFQQFHGTRFTV